MTVAANKIDRCPWPGIADPEYARYHDEEWGVPLLDSRSLFEKLILEGFQSGLSWLTILKKRNGFRAAFDNFDAVKIARYGAEDVERLMNEPGIVRNKLKIEAAISNAKAYLEITTQQPFSSFIWGHLDRPPAQNALQSLKDAPAKTDASIRLSKALLAHGFKFVGPTTVYAFMQSSGMVNDHLVACPRYKPCAKLQAAIKLPVS